MDKILRTKNKPIIFLLLSLLAYSSMSVETILSEKLWGEVGFYNYPYNEICMHYLVIISIWAAYSVILLYVLKKLCGSGIFAISQKPEKKALIISILIVIAGVADTCYSWHGFKPFIEYSVCGPIGFACQYIYYVFEVMLVLLIITFAQHFGELITKKTNIPWGGLFIAITWGAGHFYTQNFATGIECMIWGLSYGIIYNLVKKNYIVSYLMIALIFII